MNTSGPELHKNILVTFFKHLLVTYAVTNGRAGESAAYAGFMPLASPTSPVAMPGLTKVPGGWPGGLPPTQDQNGVYGSFESYTDPQYGGIYAQY